MASHSVVSDSFRAFVKGSSRMLSIYSTELPLRKLKQSFKVSASLGASGQSFYNSTGAPKSEELRKKFENLKEHLTEISALNSVSSLLFWDQQVFMPRNGAPARGRQLEAVARALHAKKTQSSLGTCIQDLIQAPLEESGFSTAEIATVREASRSFEKALRTPADLEAQSASLSSRASVLWEEARHAENFDIFAPALQEWVDLQQKLAAVVEPNLSPYDYCLDLYEPGMTAAQLDPLFARLKEPLTELLRKIVASNKQADQEFLQSMDLFSGQFSLETQARLARRFSEEIGFSYESGRLDKSTHPFTSGISSPHDVRLTARFLEKDVTSGIKAVLHEAGHGLYEQGLSAELASFGSPAATARSLGLHESQSLLWECHVGMSLEFWEHYWPVMLRSYSSLPNSKAPQFYRVMNEVKPSLIRVEADEVSYTLHVLLRYEIERGLLEGTILVQDIPEVWNQKMEEYLGIVPSKPSEGCLQDIHWTFGFGYFPTYTIGKLYACQLFEAAEKALPGLKSDISQGNFQRLKEWLRVNIHSVGSLYPTADEIVEKATGHKLDPDFFLAYVNKKYSALYDLPVSTNTEVFANTEVFTK